MGRPVFHFKQFSIQQLHSAMRVNTDSIILGAWLSCDHPARILDIGTGTGILALMMAQRNPEAHINAIEIDNQACLDARFNFDHCPWNNRLTLINGDFNQGFSFGTQPLEYHLIMSNPPFFEASLPSMDVKKQLARHQQNLNLDSLIVKASILLHKEGLLGFIAPFDLCDKISAILGRNNLYVNRQLHISSNEAKPPHRIIFEATKVRREPTTHYLSIYEKDTHQYTNAFKTLTADFYLSL